MKLKRLEKFRTGSGLTGRVLAPILEQGIYDPEYCFNALQDAYKQRGATKMPPSRVRSYVKKAFKFLNISLP